MDLLIVADDQTAAEDLRDFALEKCPALDFFLLDGAVATSCSNGSKVRGTSRKNLIERLDALLLWTATKGFAESDVDWEFEVIKGMNPMMTTLISSEPFPSKATALSVVQGLDETTVAPISNWNRIKEHPIAILVGVVLATASVTLRVVTEVRVIPLQERIRSLEKDVETLRAGRGNAGGEIRPVIR